MPKKPTKEELEALNYGAPENDPKAPLVPLHVSAYRKLLVTQSLEAIEQAKTPRIRDRAIAHHEELLAGFVEENKQYYAERKRINELRRDELRLASDVNTLNSEGITLELERLSVARKESELSHLIVKNRFSYVLSPALIITGIYLVTEGYDSLTFGLIFASGIGILFNNIYGAKYIKLLTKKILGGIDDNMSMIDSGSINNEEN